MNRLARLNDLKLSHLQEHVTKAGHIIVSNTECLLRAKIPDSNACIESLVRTNTDALALLGHACSEITQRRRESIKPHLHKDYATLCSTTVPVTKFLFGDDLQTELTHIRATNKIGTTASYTGTQSRQRQSNYQSNWQRQGQNFFGRAPPYNRLTSYKRQNNYSGRRSYTQNQGKHFKRPESQSQKWIASLKHCHLLRLVSLKQLFRIYLLTSGMKLAYLQREESPTTWLHGWTSRPIQKS